MAVFLSRWLRRLRVLREQARVEREMDEEMGFHVEQEAAELQRVRGLSAADARRQALIAFGGVERHREAGREARGVAWPGTMSLDFKLGVRMLAKHPALSVVGGLGMAVAVAIAAGFFTFTTSFYYSNPPLAEGDRIVAVENRNLLDSEDWRASLFDFHTWRQELTSVRDVAAFRRVSRNVQVPGGAAERAYVAEMTASGFRVARVAPLLGRPLVDADEVDGAQPVVVIGHREWQRIFAADPAVVGRQLRLGSTVYEVVGVMPEGFRFPTNYGLWTALPTNRSLYGPGEGPKLLVFGRLARGVSKEAAQAQLSSIGERMTVAHAAVYEHLRPTIVRYVHALLDVQQYPAWSVWVMQLCAVFLLTVVAVNVAVLVYARTAARRAEITVRTALGARRRRIVSQLFLEALVLSLLAAALGLLIAQFGYRRIALMASFETLLPYWIGNGLSPTVIPYAALLAVIAAFLVGVLPALQATGRDLQAALRRLGSAGELQMGRTWSSLIVVQVAIAVAVLPAVVAIGSKSVWRRVPSPTFPAAELLSLRLRGDLDAPPARRAQLQALYDRQQAELVRRLESEPGVSAVSHVTELTPATVETDVALAPGLRRLTRVRAVDPGWFDVMGVPLLAGRRFDPGDVADGATDVIVSRGFVRRFLSGGDVLGRAVRTVTEAGPDTGAGTSYHIIGVVEDLYVDPSAPERAEPVMYHAAARGPERLSIVVRTRGIRPADLAPMVHDIASQVAPDWQLDIAPMNELDGRLDSMTVRFLVLVIGLMTLSVLLLSAAGISALMSFAVTRRQREIGIRTALGAPRDRIVASIFSRSVRQLALGVTVGAIVAGALDRASGGELLGGQAPILLPLIAALMVLAGLLATLGPARRALRIHPMEALRQD